MLSELHRKPNTVNWASKVKDLSSLGFYEVWLPQGVGNKNMFLSELKLRLNDNFIENWDSRLTDSSRANLHCLFSNFKYQLYLEHVKVKKIRVALSKLRVSSHRLQIEVGRWSRPNRTPLSYTFSYECLGHSPPQSEKCSYSPALQDGGSCN